MGNEKSGNQTVFIVIDDPHQNHHELLQRRLVDNMLRHESYSLSVESVWEMMKGRRGALTAAKVPVAGGSDAIFHVRIPTALVCGRMKRNGTGLWKNEAQRHWFVEE